MPNLWYSYTIEKSDDLSMKFIFIDTNIMKGSGDTNNMPDSDIIDYQVTFYISSITSISSILLFYIDTFLTSF